MTEDILSNDGLTDDQLDTLLTGAANDLLTYIRATGDSASSLMALMNEPSGAAHVPSRDPVSRSQHATAVITARLQTDAFLTALRCAGPAIAVQASRSKASELVDAFTNGYDPAPRSLIADLIYGLDFAHKVCSGVGIIDSLDVKIDNVRLKARDIQRALNSAVHFDHINHLAQAYDFTAGLVFELDLVLDVARAHAASLKRTEALGSECAPNEPAAARHFVLPQVADLCRDVVEASRRMPSVPELSFIGLDADEWLGDDRVGSVHEPRCLAAEYARARNLARSLMDIPVDASSADLSQVGLDEGDMCSLVGVVWSELTRWPEDIAELVRLRSRQIGEGLYEVVGGSSWHDIDALVT